MIHFGNADLAKAYKDICEKIQYLKIRLQAAGNDVDLCIYKEQWVTRTISSIAHLCELLYTFGPPGSGKDVDALFVQEFFGEEMTGTLPTNDLVMIGQQERGVDASTPSLAAIQGKKVVLVPELPEGTFAWHRVKHFVEQQGIRPSSRANNKAPLAMAPTFAIMCWSNYAPKFNRVVGAMRRTAIIYKDARYVAVESVEDNEYVDDNRLKYRIQKGEFRLDMLWTAMAWIEALKAYSMSIPKPDHVVQLCVQTVPNEVRDWALGDGENPAHLEECTAKDATTCTEIKAAVAAHLSLGVRSPDLVTRMREAGFTLDVPASGGKKRACRFKFEMNKPAVWVKLKKP